MTSPFEHGVPVKLVSQDCLFSAWLTFLIVLSNSSPEKSILNRMVNVQTDCIFLSFPSAKKKNHMDYLLYNQTLLLFSNRICLQYY